ncbi:hypothetical protein MPSEU_000496200 [Mayamaea pseudoterrestris]|nr:hypothetical protein MPSEU_000495100 [Mayamaea pseudoterrestris]GKY95344.1 hypothetical protein MPSEU_000496200 [Mayamaea pseudoterrestris]
MFNIIYIALTITGTFPLRMSTFLLCLAALQMMHFSSRASAFILRPSYKAQKLSSQRYRSLPLSSGNALVSSSGYSDAEVGEMESLILNLSNLPTDESRRTKVAQIFNETFSASADGLNKSKRFCELFDIILIRVGDQVRREAAEPMGVAASDSDATASEVAAINPKVERTKTKEELQLWALVDMMVQSKTLVKRATGELGKDGAFG